MVETQSLSTNYGQIHNKNIYLNIFERNKRDYWRVYCFGVSFTFVRIMIN